LAGLGRRLGLQPVWWFTNPALTTLILIVAVAWYITAPSTLVLLGGLQTIDVELYDAATIDGAAVTMVVVAMNTLVSLVYSVAFRER